MRRAYNLPHMVLIAGLMLMFLSGCNGIKRKVSPAPDAPEKKTEQTVIESGEGEVTGPTGKSGEDTLKPGEKSSVSEEDIIQGSNTVETGLNDDKSHRLRDIFFEYDKATLSPVARESLAGTARWLSDNTSIKLRLEGHADERGTSEYNIALGDSRAEAGKRYLVNLGVDSGRLSTLSYGEEMPANPGQTEAAFAKNRRVHFEIAR